MLSPSFLMARVLLPLILIGLVSGCAKPDLDECRRACWNGMSVKYWAKVDREVKSMSAEKAAIYRAQKEEAFQEIAKRDEDQPFMNCVYNCQHNSNDKQIACMKAAKSERQLEICMK